MASFVLSTSHSGTWTRLNHRCGVVEKVQKVAAIDLFEKGAAGQRNPNPPPNELRLDEVYYYRLHVWRLLLDFAKFAPTSEKSLYVSGPHHWLLETACSCAPPGNMASGPGSQRKVRVACQRCRARRIKVRKLTSLPKHSLTPIPVRWSSTILRQLCQSWRVLH